MKDAPARLTETELLARLRAVRSPGPVVHIGPSYPIATFASWNNPYPDYFYGARVVLDAAIGDQVWVEEPAQNLSTSL